MGLLLISACNESTPVDPGQLPDGGSNNGGSTGGGGSDSTSLGDDALVGTWVNVRVPADNSDVSQLTTTWVFRADGVCGRSLVAESISAGVSVELRVGFCQVTASNQVTVKFTEEQSTFTMIYDFPNAARLSLDDFLYDQVASQ